MNEVTHSPASARSVVDTGQMPAILGSSSGLPAQHDDHPDYMQIQQSREFRVLRRRLRRFVFPVSVLFIVWYMAYVLLAAYAHEFMSTDIIGEINVGLILGVLQFVSTIIITVAYLKYAKKNIDPQVDLIRRQAGAGNQ